MADPNATGSRAATVHCTGCGEPILVHSDPERPRRCPECADATPDRAAKVEPVRTDAGQWLVLADGRLRWTFDTFDEAVAFCSGWNARGAVDSDD